jgi:hypothetical protein
MPDVGKVLRVDAATTETTIYTVPAATKLYVKAITVNNPTDVAQAFTLKLGDKALATNFNIPKYGGATDTATHVLLTGETIKFSASDTSIDLTIDYVEET